MRSELRINAPLTADILTRFLKEEAGNFGFENAVLGLSGGIDSAVSAVLAARAYGPDHVTGVIMPYKLSAEESESLADKLAKQLGIKTRRVDITPMADGYIEQTGGPDKLGKVRLGNVFARCRMITLYDISVEEEALVVGTSNKSELLLGYGTLFGDMASAINPLGDLYKSQIYHLAEYLDIPAEIRERKPTGDLWEGQTDEDELGFTYAEVDKLLYYYVDRRYSEADLVQKGFKLPFVHKIIRMVQGNQYKRRPPIIAKLSNRTINLDFRYLRDWGR